MFRDDLRALLSENPSPHARGDVPLRVSRPVRSVYFSPRPWGCSGGDPYDLNPEMLLPTPVGMFRGRLRAFHLL